MSVADSWWDERRFDPGPVLRERFADWTAAAERFDTTERTIMRWIERGLDWTMADTFACTLGFHPREIWPDWDDLPPDVLDDPLPPHQPKLICGPECSICSPESGSEYTRHLLAAAIDAPVEAVETTADDLKLAGIALSLLGADEYRAEAS
jgi:hypothetical protein